jgi:hypothetical protein
MTLPCRLSSLAAFTLASWTSLGPAALPAPAQSNETPPDTVPSKPRVAFRPGGKPSLQYAGITSTPKDGQHIFTIMPSPPGIPSTIVKHVAALDPWGSPIPHTEFWFTYGIQPFSAGHDHDDASRPKGTMNPEHGISGDDGWLEVTFTAPEAAGELQIDTVFVTPQNQPGVGRDFASYKIDLVPISVGQLIGWTATHGDNHWGMPLLQSALEGAYAIFHALHPAAPFRLNDSSLAGGGLFDINANWAPPHASHRWGVNVDFDHTAVPVAQRRDLWAAFIANNFHILVHTDHPHWHLTVPR